MVIMKKVYISGPYTGGKWGDNIRNAVVMGEDVYKSGHIPFIPHTHTALWSVLYSHTKREWLHIDLAWIDACDCLIRIDGESKGGDIEVDYAHQIGIPVYYSFNEFLKGETEYDSVMELARVLME